MKVLIGIGGSMFSDIVVQAVITQLRCVAVEVLVLHVLQPVAAETVPEMSADYAPELDDEKKPAHVMVERIADKLRAAGFKTDTAVEIGDPEVRILEVASAWPADLIIVGSRGQKNIHNFLLGSVSEWVARHAKCSVQIVRDPATD